MPYQSPYGGGSQLSPSAGYRNPYDTGPSDSTEDTGGGSIRMGEMVIRGSMVGELAMSIAEIE